MPGGPETIRRRRRIPEGTLDVTTADEACDWNRRHAARDRFATRGAADRAPRVGVARLREPDRDGHGPGWQSGRMRLPERRLVDLLQSGAVAAHRAPPPTRSRARTTSSTASPRG